VDEVLQVQGTLTQAQQDLEQLEGRMRYLDEHTSYSTITMSIFEAGAEVKTTTAWGVGGAFSAALHNLVRAFNAIVRGLGVLIPVLIVIAIIAYIVYLVVRAIVRRNRRRQQATYQAYQQGRTGPAGQPGVAGPGAQAVSGSQQGVSAAPGAASEGQDPAAGA
jgi:membrane protein implicated in regulation of membrane protease activity